jgi:hypothetical protein
MQHTATRLIPLAFFLVTGLTAADAGECLSMKVSPRQALAPVNLRVSVRIEPNADNRVLMIVADSPQFYRSSQIQLEGDRAPRMFSIEYPNVPGRQLRDHQRAGQQHGPGARRRSSNGACRASRWRLLETGALPDAIGDSESELTADCVSRDHRRHATFHHAIWQPVVVIELVNAKEGDQTETPVDADGRVDYAGERHHVVLEHLRDGDRPGREIPHKRSRAQRVSPREPHASARCKLND